MWTEKALILFREIIFTMAHRYIHISSIYVSIILVGFFVCLFVLVFLEQPREFLISQLEQMQASKLQAASSPCLFDDSNLDAVCGILDPTNQGYISYNQYREGKEITLYAKITWI